MLLASASYNNGNATTDGLKNLQITYNILNLPQKVSQNGATKATYTWFADRSKYSAQDNSGNGYHYIGSLIYSNNTLESTDFSQGRIALNNNTQTIHYHHKDHLGSVRAITNSSGSVIEQNAYYPFGGRHTFGQSYTQNTANRYKFNGKEEQTIGSLDLLDYGARMYDTKTARWLVQDPLAEKYYSFSAYNYCVNNPVMFVDPDGKIILSFSGGGIGGGIAILQGESPKRILSATIVGAGQGLFVASGGFLIGMAVGDIGELGEQTLNVKVFEEQSSYDFQAIAISAILGGGSSKFQKLFGGKIDQLATYIDSNLQNQTNHQMNNDNYIIRVNFKVLITIMSIYFVVFIISSAYIKDWCAFILFFIGFF